MLWASGGNGPVNGRSSFCVPDKTFEYQERSTHAAMLGQDSGPRSTRLCGVFASEPSLPLKGVRVSAADQALLQQCFSKLEFSALGLSIAAPGDIQGNY